MMETEISTYADSQDGVDLVPGRTRLLFAAWIHHGPGFPEKVGYRVGPSKCGRFDVLWIKSEWDNEDAVSAAAWMPRRQMRGKPQHLALLKALFVAQKSHASSDGPNFNEVARATNALLTSREVCDVTRKTFGDCYS
jgi:hypothetical protein